MKNTLRRTFFAVDINTKNNQKSYKNNLNSGFTIIELAVVIVVIAILATLTTFAYSKVTERAQEKAITSELHGIASSLDKIKADNGAYPIDLSGVKASTDYTYSYTRLNIVSFCVSAVIGELSYYILSGDSSTKEGDCSNLASIECPAGYIAVPGNPLFDTKDFCVMKYEARTVGGKAVSQATGLPWPWDGATPTIEGSEHIITEAEWLTVAHNALSVPSNWSGGAVGSGYIYSGHTDYSPPVVLTASTNDTEGYLGTGDSAPSSQRRTLTLTNGQVIWDFAGNLWERVEVPFGANVHSPTISGEPIDGSWKAYNSTSVSWNSFPRTSLPSYGTPEAAGWGASQNLGSLWSSSPSGGYSPKFMRGGGFIMSSSEDGIFALTMNDCPDTYCSTAGAYRLVRN